MVAAGEAHRGRRSGLRVLRLLGRALRRHGSDRRKQGRREGHGRRCGLRVHAFGRLVVAGGEAYRGRRRGERLLRDIGRACRRVSGDRLVLRRRQRLGLRLGVRVHACGHLVVAAGEAHRGRWSGDRLLRGLGRAFRWDRGDRFVHGRRQGHGLRLGVHRGTSVHDSREHGTFRSRARRARERQRSAR